MKNKYIILTTFKNNRVFNKVLEVLKTEYEIKEERGFKDYKKYKIEVPEDLSPLDYADYVLESIENKFKNFPENYSFSIGSEPELGYVFSFFVELLGSDKVLCCHRIKEIKK